MVKNLVQAMKPINLICSLSGFFYISESYVLRKKKMRFGFLEFLEIIRCCFYIYIVLHISIFDDWISFSWSSVYNAAASLSIIADYLEVFFNINYFKKKSEFLIPYYMNLMFLTVIFSQI